MAIPLVGSPAPVVRSKITQYLSGDDQNFDASLGNWTNSGGTPTRDTGFRFSKPDATYYGGSLKFATTAINQYVEVAIPGSFKKGVTYTGLLAVNNYQAANPVTSASIGLGLHGTDANSQTWLLPPLGNSENSDWTLLQIEWVPSADRSGVTLRFTRTEATGTGSLDFWIGYASVAQGQHKRLSARAVGQELVPNSNYALATRYNGGALMQLNDSSTLRAALIDAYRAGFAISNPGGTDPTTDDFVGYFYAEHAAGDRAAAGLNLQVGDDYLGLYLSELNSTTLQVYPDSDYHVEILDGDDSGAANHWHAVTADGVRSRLGGWFEQVFRVAGTLSATTDVAAYWRAPYNLRVDEVLCHVGTAPTGQALIVDVNDDGTTIFTTQGNRPSIADGTNDDTSGAPDGGTSVAKDSVITIDVDQVGSGTAGADLFVSIRGRYIW